MEENKYYTPDIEEFHLGFEYQKTDYPDVWYNGKVDLYSLSDIRTLLNQTKKDDNGKVVDSRVRVKYLDEEDILSLGFIKNDPILNTYDLNEFVISTHNKIFHDTNTVVTLYSGYVITKKGRLIFEGVIKNKSELKVLLKQLNITT